jgi:hypothetical protein
MTEVQSRHDTEPLTMTVEEAAKALGIGKN